MTKIRSETDTLHRDWSLATNEHGVSVTEFEWGILRFISAFERSCVQLSRLASAEGLKFQEVILVHVVAMQRGKPTAASLARQLNRDDVQNLQYSLRKLVEGNYLLQSKKAGSRVVTYSIDTKGQQFVEDYAGIRSKLLASRTGFIEDIDAKLSSASQLIGVLTGIYDSAAMVSSTYSPVFGSVENIDGITDCAE